MTLQILLSHTVPLSVASSYDYISNGLMMAEEEIPDPLKPTEILTLTKESLELTLKAFSLNQI